MKSSTRLTSAVFQLTPTRTRCDLIIIANDKKEKIASGLLSPFLAHLKTAQDQIAKGGYSILLLPETDDNAVWFTKATLQRFVRFVSTPEILERVYTIETEILQIEQGIASQNSIEPVHSIQVEDQLGNPPAAYEGNKPVTSTDDEKAIVLYKPGEQSIEVNGSDSVEGNSKVELLKVLKSRKIVLQNEQAMAFARAVAAGFDIDQIVPLLSFAECFQAFRLMEACSKFMGLWKIKHETGQWLDIDASEVSTRGELSAINSSGIILSASPNKLEMSNSELPSDDVGLSDRKNSVGNPLPNGQQVYYQGQFPHLMVPPWVMHAPPGTQPVFPSYPVHGMPYYQGPMGNSPAFQPPYNPVEHSTSNFRHQPGQEGQAPDGMDNNIGAETWELDRALVDMDGGVSHEQKPRKRSGGSTRRKAGTVVIRNINYITPKGKKSGCESISGSEDGTNETADSDDNQIINQDSKRFSNGKGSMDEISKSGKNADDGEWQAFQNCLLRGNDEDAHAGMFAMEKNVSIKRRMNTANDDPLALGALGTGEIQDMRMKDIQGISASTSRRLQGSDGDSLLSRSHNGFRGTGDQLDIEYAEFNGRKVLSRTTQEDVMMGRRHNQINSRSLDTLAMDSCEVTTIGMNREFLHGTPDEACIVPSRYVSMNQVGQSDIMAIHLESEIPLAHQKLDSEGNTSRISYEPDDLSMMPERGAEKRSSGYDLAVEYEMQALASREQAKGVKSVTDVKGKSRKSDKSTSSKVVSGSGRPGGPIRNARSSKMTPLEDARARAERLRSYKADLQKLKKEKEEAEAKRLEALKLQRQKRIAAKGNSTAAVKPAASSPQSKMHAKLSPASNKGSKFSDAEPGSSSPLQRSKVRIPLVSSDQLKASKTSKLGEGSHMAGNRLTRSSSSLSETKKESNGVTPDSKSSMARIRRLSEPKIINNIPVTSVKARSAEAVSKRKLSEGSAKNKISAIIHLDRSKAATLPELKTKASVSHANSGEIKSDVHSAELYSGMKSSTLCEDAVNVSTPTGALEVDADENPIVEKSVVVHEYEKPSRKNSLATVTKSEVQNQQYDGYCQGGKSNSISGLVPKQALLSPMVGAPTEPNRLDIQKNSDFSEGLTANSEKDPPKNAMTDKSYQAPYARVSSIEDPCTGQSEYFKAPVPRPDLAPEVEETVNVVHIPAVKNVKLDKHIAAVEKTRVKESSRGFRRLLKFGKKNHSSSVDQSVDSDCSIDGTIEQDDSARRTGSTSQVHMLKNLISQEETSSAGNTTSHKSSRHFSLFSPFRSKTSEKKQAS